MRRDLRRRGAMRMGMGGFEETRAWVKIGSEYPRG